MHGHAMHEGIRVQLTVANKCNKTVIAHHVGCGGGIRVLVKECFDLGWRSRLARQGRKCRGAVLKIICYSSLNGR